VAVQRWIRGSTAAWRQSAELLHGAAGPRSEAACSGKLVDSGLSSSCGSRWWGRQGAPGTRRRRPLLRRGGSGAAVELGFGRRWSRRRGAGGSGRYL